MSNDRSYLESLKGYYARHRALPSFASIGGLLGLKSKSSVAALVARLKLAGFLESTPDRRLAPTRRFFARPGAIRTWVLVGMGVGLLLRASAASAQFSNDLASTLAATGQGWAGFVDLDFLLHAFLTLVLATVLGAVVGYHPHRIRTCDTLEEIDAPKVSIVYAVIGALIGILVVKYGMVVGFVLFGIGGLIRFRSAMGSSSLTGQAIFVTLIGLACGLNLPPVAVLATAFDFVLTLILERQVTHRVDVRALPHDRFSEAAGAYRDILEGHRYRVLSETKRPDKGRVSFIFRGTGRDTRHYIDHLFAENIDPSLRGSLDWEAD